MNTYEIDTLVALTVQFTDAASPPAPKDPTDVFLYVQGPGQAEQTFQYSLGQITRTGTGAYSANVNATISGAWTYKWQGTGVVEVTTRDTLFLVNPSTLIAG